MDEEQTSRNMETKNAGKADATISEEKSLKKLVSPRMKTLRFSPKILFLINPARSLAH